MNNQIVVTVGLIVTVAVCMIGGTVEGQVDPDPFKSYLIKDNPEELTVNYVQGESCHDTYEHIIDSELAQSRIRKTFSFFNELQLTVNVSCLDMSRSNSFVYVVEVYFGITRFNIGSSEVGQTPTFYEDVHFEPDYGNFGVSSKDDEGAMFLASIVRKQVEAALTDYLKANFDL